MKRLILMVITMGLIGYELNGENPSYERQRRGQITYADDQLFYRDGSIAASPASDTFQVQCEQNHFVLAVSSGSAQIGFSALANGSYKFITVFSGESLALPLEVSSGTFCRIRPISGGISFRFIATGRTDYNKGSVK